MRTFVIQVPSAMLSPRLCVLLLAMVVMSSAEGEVVEEVAKLRSRKWQIQERDCNYKHSTKHDITSSCLESGGGRYLTRRVQHEQLTTTSRDLDSCHDEVEVEAAMRLCPQLSRPIHSTRRRHVNVTYAGDATTPSEAQRALAPGQ